MNRNNIIKDNKTPSILASGKPVLKDKVGRGGFRANAGRPRTGRSHSVCLKLDDEAYKIWAKISNKSETVNRLIKEISL